MKTNSATIRSQMKRVLKKVPYLTCNGFSVRSGDALEMLSDCTLNEFEIAKAWLSMCDRRKTVNRNNSSYGYKHMVEDWAGTYISNGAMIAAAIAMDIKVEPCHYASLNAYFAISSLSVRRLAKLAEERRLARC
jgi:hypothetical protein